MAGNKKYLLLFAQDFVEFRYPEIDSIIKLLNINVKVPKFTQKPYWIIDGCKEEDVKLISTRSVSLKFIAEIWTSGRTYDEFHENARKYKNEIPEKYKTETFKFLVETYNKHLKLPQRVAKIETMHYLDETLGKIDLKNPTNHFLYFEFYGMNPLDVPENPEEIILGRWIADGQRDLFNKISLKTRKFIGNTR